MARGSKTERRENQLENTVRYLCNGEKEDCEKQICYKTIGDREKDSASESFRLLGTRSCAR